MFIASFSSMLSLSPSAFRMDVSRFCRTFAYILFSFFAWQLDVLLADTHPSSTIHATPTAATAKPAQQNLPKNDTTSGPSSSGGDVVDDDGLTRYPGKSLYDSGMLRRIFFVLIGATALVVICFAYRWFRSHSRRKTKKYGVLATRSADMELRPLDQEDDEEDMTVFDVNSK